MKKLLIFVYALSFSLLLSSCGDEPYDISDGGIEYANISGPLAQPYVANATASLSVEVHTDVAPGMSLSGTSAFLQLSITDDQGNTTTSDRVVVADMSASTSEERVFNFDHTALFTNLPVDGNIWNDAQLGDLLIAGGAAKWELTFEGGTVGTISPDFVYKHTASVVCESSIPTEGTWAGRTTEGAFGVFSTSTGTTLAAGSGPGDYSMSDITGHFYTAFGFNADQPAVINDFCAQIFVKDAPDAQFNIGTPTAGPGSWDAGSETLTVAWYDFGNDFGDITIYERE
jgi:hypothetical protein